MHLYTAYNKTNMATVIANSASGRTLRHQPRALTYNLEKSTTIALIASIIITLILIISLTLAALRLQRPKQTSSDRKPSETSSLYPTRIDRLLCGFGRRSNSTRPMSELRAKLLNAKRRETRRVDICFHVESGKQNTTESSVHVPQIWRTRSLPLGVANECAYINGTPIEKPARVHRSSTMQIIFDSSSVRDMPWLITMPPESVPHQ